MSVGLSEAIHLANVIRVKNEKGTPLVKGEEIILTLARNYVKIASREYDISDDTCKTMIEVWENVMEKLDTDSVEIQKSELNLIIEAIHSRLK